MEELKPLGQVTQPDVRNRYWNLTLDHLHASAESIELLPAVPEAVRNQFQIARNALVYSYFFFTFQSVALLYSILAVELALSMRIKRDHPEMFRRKREPSLFDLLAVAVRDRLLLDSGFRDIDYPEDYVVTIDPRNPQAPPAPPDQRYCYTILHQLPDLRNDLAHGQYVLAPAMSDLVARGAELINQLYRPAVESSE